ncbi:unnamed protein product [Boreogadus saida]
MVEFSVRPPGGQVSDLLPPVKWLKEMAVLGHKPCDSEASTCDRIYRESEDVSADTDPSPVTHEVSTGQ